VVDAGRPHPDILYSMSTSGQSTTSTEIPAIR
jgi:hypothetical protein